MKLNNSTDNLLLCAYCDKKFKYDSERKRHEKCHSPQFHCKVCDKKFSFISALKRHEKQHERGGSVECGQCNKHFKDEVLLKRHIKYAHEGQYSCTKCSTTFSSESALRTHLKSHKPVSERRYKCKYKDCNKAFNYLHHLIHHEFTHSTTKPYYCHVCDKGFIQYHHLKTHLKSHDPDVKLPCIIETCKKNFSNEYARRRHIQTHKSEDVRSQEQLDFLKNVKKDVVFCASCGQMIAKQNYPKHCLVCEDVNKNEKPGASLLVKPANDKDIMKPEVDNDNIKHIEVDTSNNISLMSCNSVIGRCLTKDNNDESKECLCAQMSSRDNDGLDFDEPEADSNISENYKNVLKESTGNDNKSSCFGCECAIDLSKANEKTYCPNKMPVIEYLNGGVIKIKELFDESIIFRGEGKVSREKNNVKLNNNDSGLFNSCKAVLGKCLVSEDGSMGEGCLCAKMVNDSFILDAQEIDEITPNPDNLSCT